VSDDARLPGPLLAPRGASPAEASRPDQALDAERYHTYESNPVPWWVTLIWVSFFVFGIVYLIRNLIE
jgi:hypothetical protein